MSFFLFLPHCPCPEILTNKHHSLGPNLGPKLSPCLLKYTAKQGHNYPVLRNSSQFFLWQIIVRLIWNGNTLRLSSKSTIFKQKIHLNCRRTMKFQDRNVAHAHCTNGPVEHPPLSCPNLVPRATCDLAQDGPRLTK